MSYNPTKDYGRNARRTDKIQQDITKLEKKYWQSRLGARDQSEKVLDQDKLRDQLSRVKALLAEIRVYSQEIVEEMKSEIDLRKGLLELGKG